MRGVEGEVLGGYTCRMMVDVEVDCEVGGFWGGLVVVDSSRASRASPLRGGSPLFALSQSLIIAMTMLPLWICWWGDRDV